MAERRVVCAEGGQGLDGDEPLRGEDGVVRHRSVALGEQEPVAVGVVDGCRGDVQDSVVEHPQHVERGVGAGGVLLVAGHGSHEPGESS
jgi:hypothetical protein